MVPVYHRRYISNVGSGVVQFYIKSDVNVNVNVNVETCKNKLVLEWYLSGRAYSLESVANGRDWCCGDMIRAADLVGYEETNMMVWY